MAIACLKAEDAAATLTLTSPVSSQVFQRGKEHQADILMEGTVSDKADVIEAKADLAPGAKRGAPTKWVAVTSQGQSVQGQFSGRLTLPAGGWYQVTVRARMGTRILAEQALDKVGVGEVFVTAGQSNSANFGNPRQEAQDGRVVYFDGKGFVHAKDPIPGGCGGGCCLRENPGRPRQPKEDRGDHEGVESKRPSRPSKPPQRSRSCGALRRCSQTEARTNDRKQPLDEEADRLPTVESLTGNQGDGILIQLPAKAKKGAKRRKKAMP